MCNRVGFSVLALAILAAGCGSLIDNRLDDRTSHMLLGASPSAALGGFGAAPSSPPPHRIIEEGDEPPPDTGTDPRDFADKFMPYYRYTKLENGVKENNMSIFGLFAFAPNFAMTYEWPLALEREIDPGDDIGPPINPNPVDQTGDDTGIGDLNLRFMYRNQDIAIGPVEILPVCELWFPTANQDSLGSGQLQLAPGFAAVSDLGFWPYSFMALMNFYQFDVYGDDFRDDVSFYKGRWFFMFPFPTLTYVMPEMQPIYDFEEDTFSFWIGPEVGQIFGEGKVLYVKPGFGIENNQDVDREFTFEFGWRWFF